jgi:hypothetical protein
MQELEQLSAAVQRNCHISDARHARDYTLCVYLLKMREYYRWEKGYSLTAPLPQDDLGEWVVERERLWDCLARDDFDCLPVGDGCRDPFDAEAVNQRLVPAGLVYSAGFGRFVKPHFFLGRLLRHETVGGFRVFVSDDEYARDLSAPPAMTQGRNIFVRRDALRRMLWERIEEWRWRPSPESPMARAVAGYDFDVDPERALDAMTDQEVDAAVLHELGEGSVGELLGDGWSEMMMSLARSRAELQARAVRDLLADCLVTLPALLDRQAEPSLHFFFGNFGGMRRELFPALLGAYETWLQTGDASALRDAVSRGHVHWRPTADTLVARFRELGDGCADAINAYLETRALT